MLVLINCWKLKNMKCMKSKMEEGWDEKILKLFYFFIYTDGLNCVIMVLDKL